MRIKQSPEFIVGRKTELNLLDEKYESTGAELVVLYGRRRVGKSALIRFYAHSKPHLFFEGLAKESTPVQLEHFVRELKRQIDDPLLQNAVFIEWASVFDFLTSYFRTRKKKMIIFFDEFQWMAAGQSRLVSLIKYYWDNHWKQQHVMLVLCGSVASFIVKKVIRSKALYGRITLQLQLRKLTFSDGHQLVGRTKTGWDTLKYMLVLGGVPKYLRDIHKNRSFEENICRLFFSPSPLYEDEFDKIFNVHFKRTSIYLKIVNAMDRESLTLEEISRRLGIKSSGGVKAYLENLELADFVRSYIPFDRQATTTSIKYRVSDEFLLFYMKFVQPYEKVIKAGGGGALFKNKIRRIWQPWFGFSFENFCLNHAVKLSRIMGFDDQIETFGPFFQKKAPGFQFDLVYKRTDDVIVCCEIKCQDGPVGVEVIAEFQKKLSLFRVQSKQMIQKALIAPSGADESLKTLGYFDHIVSLEAMLQGL